MGEVYLAEDVRLSRLVALKVMSAELARNPNQRKRFQTEAKAAGDLSHPNICALYEVGETKEHRPFLVMEYVEGQPLNLVLQHRRLTLAQTVDLGFQVADALAAAHAQGLVHRDIKPGNLMLARGGQAKVMNFGLAKWFGPAALSSATSSPAHTRTGMIIGTPQYRSPEQALGHPLDPRTDIFSLGVVLYEILAGQRPFLWKTVGESINSIVNQPAPALDLGDSLFSPVLHRIIFKCLEKVPQKRYASAAELALELRNLKDSSHRTLPAGMLHTGSGAPPAAAGVGQRPTAL